MNESSAKSDEQVKAEMDDVEMMKRPHLWPNLVLPLKTSGIRRTALWQYDPDKHRGFVAFDANLFAAPKKLEWEEATPERLVADGWMVD